MTDKQKPENPPMNIEVGKTYHDYRGVRVNITSRDHSQKDYQFRGLDAFGEIHYFTEKGKIIINQDEPNWLDLKNEVK